MPSSISRVTVFTGSSPGSKPTYREAAVAVGSALASEGIGVVYGGGNVGLMGAVATAASDAGGEVYGVIPKVLVDKEIAHEELTRLEVVDDMHERKMRMAELGDAFVALPGGIGTLEEFFEAWTWLQLGIHAKPIALYDVDGFWQPLLDLMDRLVSEGFVKAELRDGLIVATSPDELLDALRSWRAPTPKWEAHAEMSDA
ncbi:TIGR00730 family Rossman fold protein [Microbacterium sp. G2-8]|uniref:LOG family protein n=1 Tax=Microbacterium sp. G2-8 TaxID=2842454 RepID=UPI0021AAD460|nr:TIGR00730 family Rossman fold protein [Microbacterium sp. G2-8]